MLDANQKRLLIRSIRVHSISRHALAGIVVEAKKLYACVLAVQGFHAELVVDGMQTQALKARPRLHWIWDAISSGIQKKVARKIPCADVANGPGRILHRLTSDARTTGQTSGPWFRARNSPLPKANELVQGLPTSPIANRGIRTFKWIGERFQMMTYDQICEVIMLAQPVGVAAVTLFPNNNLPYTVLNPDYTETMGNVTATYLLEKAIYDATASVMELLGENKVVDYDTANAQPMNLGPTYIETIAPDVNVTNGGWWNDLWCQAALADARDSNRADFFNMHKQAKTANNTIYTM